MSADVIMLATNSEFSAWVKKHENLEPLLEVERRPSRLKQKQVPLD
jgi:hypothetical protein